MTRIVFLSSGRGGNLAAVHLLSKSLAGENFSVVSTIADRECVAERVAARLGIPSLRVKYSRSAPAALQEALTAAAPDFIVTTFHKVIDASTLALFPGRFINLHYSLLPAFAGTIGTEPILKALRSGCKILGSTAHVVNETLDLGPVLGQASFGLVAGDTDTAVIERMFRCASVLLTSSIVSFRRHGSREEIPASVSVVETSSGPITFSPGLAAGLAWPAESFWSDVKQAAHVA